MLPLAKVLEIQRLLGSTDLSCRKIAKQVEVSRGVVNAIANGTRGVHGREAERVTEELRAERCGECGEMVYPPCVACRARDYRKRRVRDRSRAA